MHPTPGEAPGVDETLPQLLVICAPETVFVLSLTEALMKAAFLLPGKEL